MKKIYLIDVLKDKNLMKILKEIESKFKDWDRRFFIVKTKNGKEIMSYSSVMYETETSAEKEIQQNILPYILQMNINPITPLLNRGLKIEGGFLPEDEAIIEDIVVEVKNWNYLEGKTDTIKAKKKKFLKKVKGNFLINVSGETTNKKYIKDYNIKPSKRSYYLYSDFKIEDIGLCLKFSFNPKNLTIKERIEVEKIIHSQKHPDKIYNFICPECHQNFSSMDKLLEHIKVEQHISKFSKQSFEEVL